MRKLRRRRGYKPHRHVAMHLLPEAPGTPQRHHPTGMHCRHERRLGQRQNEGLLNDLLVRGRPRQQLKVWYTSVHASDKKNKVFLSVNKK